MTQPAEPPTLTRMWGNQARDIAFDVHCYRCNQCFVEAGGWYQCEKRQCDEAIPKENIVHWEDAKATVKRLGRSPLQICMYVGTC